MDLNSKEICDILEFWREVEILTPFEIREEILVPRTSKNPKADTGRVFRWDTFQPGGSKAFDALIHSTPVGFDRTDRMNVFTVCLGVIQTDDYIKKVVEILRKENRELDSFEFDMRFSETATKGKMCLASFKVNHFGKVADWTFNPSYALCWLIQKQMDETYGKQLPNVDATKADLIDQFVGYCHEKLHRSTAAIEDLGPKDRNHVVYDILYGRMKEGFRLLKDLRSQDELRVTSEFIDAVCKYISDMSGIPSNNAVWVVQNGQKSPRQVFDDFFNSPYVTVLKGMEDTLREGNPNKLLSETLKTFFTTACDQPNKKDILSVPANLYEIVNPAAFNLGRWPAPLDHRLACLQQLAVSRMRQTDSGNPIMAINGPPGTGKTTLLRELIADLVVDRAVALAQIEDIRKAELFDHLSDGYYGEVRVLKKQYAADSAVIVASHTNRAVENITKEFPLQYGYENKSKEEADYFGTVAKQLLNDGNAWGLISVALGRAANWNAVYSILFGMALDKEGNETKKSKLRVIFDEETEKEGGFQTLVAKWEDEKIRFLRLHEEVRSALRKSERLFDEEVEAASIHHEKKKKNKKFDVSEPELDIEKLKFNFSDKRNIRSHLEPLYTDSSLDQKRTELFLSALRLHKLTLLVHSDRFVPALKSAFITLAKYEPTSHIERYLETFAFFIPVISTTFASSPYRFTKFSKSTIPWVIVDEASQVSPQAAVLLMQKAKRFIVMGDPKQLEPVMPLPMMITEMLAHRNAELEKWSPHNVSLQTLCDGTQVYGAWIGKPNEGVWTGFPLRVHRRCFSPMFNISNEISYSGQMIQADELKNKDRQKDFIPSFWFNVVPKEPSSGNGVDDETEAVAKVLAYIYTYLK
ncbi:MAG: AAA family ATPase, partial [Burkholderiales bacterium]|nr:AAA family ATPase [Burkholderiales bacterium]